MTTITSGAPVLNVYSPAAITPTVAFPSALTNPIDFTWPSKYSFTFNMQMRPCLHKREVATISPDRAVSQVCCLLHYTSLGFEAKSQRTPSSVTIFVKKLLRILTSYVSLTIVSGVVSPTSDAVQPRNKKARKEVSQWINT